MESSKDATHLYDMVAWVFQNHIVDGLLVDVDATDVPRFYFLGAGLLVSCLVFWICFRALLRSFVSIPFSHWVLGKPKKFKSTVKQNVSEHSKFQVAFWQTAGYTILFSYGIWTLLHEKDWVVDYEKYVLPVTKISWIISLYYQLTISYYLYSSYLLIFVDHRMKDFTQMLFHHLVTLFLTFGSYYAIIRSHIGIIIMILHDASDPFLHIAKMFKYANKDNVATFFFSIFALIFLATRCILYPFFVVFPLFWVDLGPYGSLAGPIAYIGSLIILLVLNIYWAFLVLKMAVRCIISGNVDQDIREKQHNDE
jgi:hypothetical protein